MDLKKHIKVNYQQKNLHLKKQLQLENQQKKIDQIIEQFHHH